MPKKRGEPKPPPILKFQTSTEYEHAERIRELLDQARLVAATGSVGAVARKRQYLNALINPHATSFVYEDHGGQRRATVTLSSNVARDRLDYCDSGVSTIVPAAIAVNRYAHTSV